MYADVWAMGSQRTWSDIWSRFEIELDKLMDLTVWWNVDADIPDEHVESENTRYSVLDVCVGYVHGEFRWSVIRMQNPPYHIPIREEEHDNPSLERLQRIFFKVTGRPSRYPDYRTSSRRRLHSSCVRTEDTVTSDISEGRPLYTWGSRGPRVLSSLYR